MLDEEAARRVPETLQATILARIDRLPEEARRVVQTGAVLGRTLLAATADARLRRRPGPGPRPARGVRAGVLVERAEPGPAGLQLRAGARAGGGRAHPADPPAPRDPPAGCRSHRSDLPRRAQRPRRRASPATPSAPRSWAVRRATPCWPPSAPPARTPRARRSASTISGWRRAGHLQALRLADACCASCWAAAPGCSATWARSTRQSPTLRTALDVARSPRFVGRGARRPAPTWTRAACVRSWRCRSPSLACTSCETDTAEQAIDEVFARPGRAAPGACERLGDALLGADSTAIGCRRLPRRRANLVAAGAGERRLRGAGAGVHGAYQARAGRRDRPGHRASTPPRRSGWPASTATTASCSRRWCRNEVLAPDLPPAAHARRRWRPPRRRSIWR